MRCKGHSLLSAYALGPPIFVTHRIFNLPLGQRSWSSSLGKAARTCMFTLIPSPGSPSTVAVTTTSVSLATKFLTHRSLCLSLCFTAPISNFRASATAKKRKMLLKALRKDREDVMLDWCLGEADVLERDPPRVLRLTWRLARDRDHARAWR